MKKIFLTYFFTLSLYSHLFSQQINNSATTARIKGYYELAIKFKDGKGVVMNYDSAFSYFKKAAALGDPQSVYSVAYMYYKGLGCIQNYDSAAELFSKGVALKRDNSLYFYGLCWRNGYGRPKNEDTAKYYLKKSADLGYRQAMMELESKNGENSNDSAAHVLLAKLHNAAIPNNLELNHFTKIQPRLPSSDIIAGDYAGWLIQYDWSGKYIIEIKKLSVNLNLHEKKISGEWIENDNDTAKIHGLISGDSVVFNKTSYSRTDHYSLARGIQYDFQDAKLSLVETGDTIFLAGNIAMFSLVRGEPSKPLFVALARPGLKNLDSLFLKSLALTAYPNPFGNMVTVQFNIFKPATVEVRLYDTRGLLLYRNFAGTLPEGTYSLPVTGLQIVSGVYILKLILGNRIAALKIIKE